MDNSFSIIPPPLCLEGFWCFFTILTPLTIALFFFGIIDNIDPDLPLSLPVITKTLSPFFNFIFTLLIFYKTSGANEIILVADNFIRVIESISSINKDGNDNVKPLIDGIDLIFKDFLKTLEKFDIKRIDCLGKKFDPNFHQAVSEEINNDKEVDEIIKVIQDGYLIKDRLLRPASVVVIAKKDENKKK